MGRYIARRLLQLIFVVFGISFILFTILSLTPGDPAMLILGDAATAESIAAKRAELGLDDPFFKRYFDYLFNIFVHGDFGNSYRSGLPVFEEVFARFPNTVKLSILTILISSIFGILFGVLSAVKQYTWIDNTTLAFTLPYADTAFRGSAGLVPDLWRHRQHKRLYPACHSRIRRLYGKYDQADKDFHAGCHTQ